MKLFTAITALIATIGFASAAPAPNDQWVTNGEIPSLPTATTT